MVRRIFGSVRQYESHRQLIASVRAAAGRPSGAGLNAIIVPASRHAQNLESAVTLARAAGCLLVVFCSHEAAAAGVVQVLAGRRFDAGVVVPLPPDYCHPLLQFESSDIARAGPADLCINPNGNLSTKRNLALLLARMTGWRRIFFMDDDVRDISPGDLAATVSLLARFRSAGMRVIDVPDNSVVCHAHRATGAHQDVFVSGSALAIRPHLQMGFFPEVYNEDWFFFYGDAQGQGLGWSGRNATQLYYDPFENMYRAARQEFGDVLAEGLYALLHHREENDAGNRDFWKAFLAARQSFLQNILRRSRWAAPEIQGRMIDAVHVAMGSLKKIKPWMCEEYIRAWGRDLEAWKGTLASLPVNLSVDSALEWLGLSPAGGQGPAGQTPAAQAGGRDRRPVRPAAIPQVRAGSLLQGRGAGGSRGRYRRSGVIEELGMQIFGSATLRAPVATDAGEGILWAEADATTETMALGSPGFRPIPCDPGLELLRSFSNPATADLATVAGHVIREDQEALTGH